MWMFLASVTQDGPGAVAPAPADLDTYLAPPAQGIQIHMGPFDVEPFSEQYFCEIRRVPEAAGLKVGALEHLSSPAGHHFNAFALLLEPEDGEIVGPCDEVWANATMAFSSPIYASQTDRFIGHFPEGVAGEMPSEWVLLEYHTLNSGDDVAQAEVYFNAYERPEYQHLANGLYGNNTAIELDPGEQEVVSATCPIEVDMELFVLTSHSHQLNQRFEVLLDGEIIYSDDDWASPELMVLSDDPISLKAGDELTWRCHYDNTTDQTVEYGPKSTDEMCMLAGVYYPDQGFQICR